MYPESSSRISYTIAIFKPQINKTGIEKFSNFGTLLLKFSGLQDTIKLLNQEVTGLITLSKLAALAHVSVSTASKAFSMSSEVNEQTREMIFRIAKEQGCFKKFFNAKYPKYVIAVICPEYKSLFYSTALSLLQEYLSEHSCEVCVASTNFSAQTEADLLEYYSRYATVDGIIIIDGRITPDQHTDIPIATIFPNPGCAGNINVVGDCTDAVTQGLRHFLQKGIRDIGFIGDPHTDAKHRLFARLADTLSPGLKVSFMISPQRFEAGGYAAMERFAADGHIPRTIFCAYDYMAIGAIRYCWEHKLRVPEEIAIIGMDDIPENKYLNPPLSSINFNMDKICAAAAEAMMKRLTDPAFTLNETVPATLHLRASSEL